MYTNEDVLEGKWKQLKGEVRRFWGELTDDDLDRIAGNRDKLAGMLQERYGYAKEEAYGRIADFLDDVETRIEER
jgi:uncharacterized protein YjbJ (UPF0337 family)